MGVDVYRTGHSFTVFVGPSSNFWSGWLDWTEHALTQAKGSRPSFKSPKIQQPTLISTIDLHPRYTHTLSLSTGAYKSGVQVFYWLGIIRMAGHGRNPLRQPDTWEQVTSFNFTSLTQHAAREEMHLLSPLSFLQTPRHFWACHKNPSSLSKNLGVNERSGSHSQG